MWVSFSPVHWAQALFDWIDPMAQTEYYQIFDRIFESELDMPLVRSDSVDSAFVMRRADAPIEIDGKTIHVCPDLGDESGVVEVIENGHEIFVSYRGWVVCADLKRSLLTVEERWASIPFFVFFERIVAPILLLLQESTLVALHGAVVEWEGQAWIFVGEGGVGKSTTALELVRIGARLVADDLALVDVEGLRVLPGACALRLWQPEGALGEAELEIRSSPASEKRWFGLKDRYRCGTPKPIAAIVVLERSDTESGINRLSGQLALVRVLGQAFSLTEPCVERRTSRLKNVSHLVRHLPVLSYVFAGHPEGRPEHVSRLLTLMKAIR
jgi:hypothetical protein